MWDLSSLPGMKPVSPALEGRFLTTGPPGHSPRAAFHTLENSVFVRLPAIGSHMLKCHTLFEADITILSKAQEPRLLLKTKLFFTMCYKAANIPIWLKRDSCLCWFQCSASGPRNLPPGISVFHISPEISFCLLWLPQGTQARGVSSFLVFEQHLPWAFGAKRWALVKCKILPLCSLHPIGPPFFFKLWFSFSPSKSLMPSVKPRRTELVRVMSISIMSLSPFQALRTT